MTITLSPAQSGLAVSPLAGELVVRLVSASAGRQEPRVFLGGLEVAAVRFVAVMWLLPGDAVLAEVPPRLGLERVPAVVDLGEGGIVARWEAPEKGRPFTVSAVGLAERADGPISVVARFAEGDRLEVFPDDVLRVLVPVQ